MNDDKLTGEFLELVEQHKKMIYKVSHMYCDSESMRMDIFQEIVINLWKAYPQFKGKSKISTWVYRVSLNTAISWFRDNSNHNNHIEYTNLIPSFGEENGTSELQDKIYNAIEHLGKIDKALILLQLDGYSYDDIADIIGITKTNVATKLNRLKLKLKSHLSNN